MRLLPLPLIAVGLLCANPKVKASTPIPDTIIHANSPGLIINLAKHIKYSGIPTNTVVVNSSMGNFCIQLFPTNAPATVANFLEYVTNGSYENMLVDLALPGSIMRTGDYLANGSLPQILAFPAITNEFGIAGLSNIRGTVAMTLTGTNPDSATSGWFINVTNNSSKFDATNTNDNPPCTVFGQITGNGMTTVIDKAAALTAQNLSAYGSLLTNVPLQGYNGGTIYLNNLVTIYNVVVPPAVVCSDTNSFSVEIQGTNLIVKPLAPNTAAATISVYSADTNGNAEVLSFHVSQEKLPQTINFPTSYTTFTSSSFGLPNFPTASSGLGVTVTARSGPLYFSKGTPYLKSPGVLTLLASQPGNTLYAPAPPVIGFVIVDKAPQTIYFSSIPNQTNATPPFSLSITNLPFSTSGLPVSIALQSGPATLKSNKLAITNDGTITLSATQAGNGNYYPATPVTKSFVVTSTNTSTNTNAVTNSIIVGK